MGTGSSNVTIPVVEWPSTPEPGFDNSLQHRNHPRNNNNNNNNNSQHHRDNNRRQRSLRDERRDSGQSYASSSTSEPEEDFTHYEQKTMTKNKVPLFIQPSTPLKEGQRDLEEMKDLERTLDSLGIPETKIDSKEERWIGVKDEVSEKLSKKLDVNGINSSTGFRAGTTLSVESSLSSGPNLSAGPSLSARPSLGVDLSDSAMVSNLSEMARLSEGTTNLSVAVLSERAHSGPQTKMKQRTRAVKKMKLKAVSAPTNLKWSPDKAEPPTEDWIYNMKEIDGFDPNKFRSENNGSMNGVSIELPKTYVSSSSPATTLTSHPHSVPEYDSVDEQIFDTIEREFSRDLHHDS